MAIVAMTWGLHVGQPVWLVAAALLVPVWLLGRRSLGSFNPVRRTAA